MGSHRVPTLLLGLLLAGPQSGVAQIVGQLKVYSASGQSRPVIRIPGPKGSPDDSVWHIQAHPGDQVLQLSLGMGPDLPMGATMTNDSIATPAFKILPGVHTSPSNYQLLLDLPAQNTVTPVIDLAASTGQVHLLKLYVARPPFGWASSTCDTRPPTIVTKPAAGSVTFEIAGIDFPNEVKTYGSHEVRLVGVDDPRDERTGTLSPAGGKWNASFSPGAASSYRAYITFETNEPYFDERANEFRSKQEACYPIAVHNIPVTDATLTLNDGGKTRVDNIYPGESLTVNINPSSGSLRLASGDYHVVDGRLQPVGNMHVIHTTAVGAQITEALADITLNALANPNTTGRLYITSRTPPLQPLHALNVRVRQVPEVTEVRIRRDAIIRSGEIWSKQPFTFILNGSGLGDHIYLRTEPDLSPSAATASGSSWYATTLPANLAGFTTVRLSLTDNRRVFPLRTPDLKVISNPIAHPLPQLVTLQGKRAPDIGSIARGERKKLGTLKLQFEPPSDSTLGPQHLRMRMTVRTSIVDSTVVSDILPIQIGPGDPSIDREIQMFFAGDTKISGILQELSTPGSRVQLALWHDPDAHPAARDTTIFQVVNSKRSRTELKVGFTPGVALWRTGVGGFGDKAGDPLAGPSLMFETSWFDDFGEANPLRIHIGLLFPKTVVSESHPDEQAEAQTDVTIVDRTKWLGGIAGGFTFKAPMRGHLAGVRVGASVGWLSGGRWVVFLHPGGLDFRLPGL